LREAVDLAEYNRQVSYFATMLSHQLSRRYKSRSAEGAQEPPLPCGLGRHARRDAVATVLGVLDDLSAQAGAEATALLDARVQVDAPAADDVWDPLWSHGRYSSGE
jgi:hypothetical protein